MPRAARVPLILEGREMAERRRVMRKWVSGSAEDGGADDAWRIPEHNVREGRNSVVLSRDVEAMSAVVAVRD